MPLSYHQERLWFIDQFETGVVYDSSPVYHNLPLVLEMRGDVSHAALEEGLNRVFARHQALRSRWLEGRDLVTEEPWAGDRLRLAQLDLSGVLGEGDEDHAIDTALRLSQEPFAFARERLVRAALVKKAEREYLLVVTIHHIVADRHSLGIIAEDLAEAYGAALAGGPTQAPAPALTYADYAQWQLSLPEEALEQLLFYWKYKLAGKVRALEIPEQRARPAVHTFTAARHSFSVDAGLLDRVRACSERIGCSEVAVLLAAFKVVLRRYARQDEIVVGTSADARSDPNVERVVGPIANLLVLRTQVSGESTLEELARDVDKTVTQGRRHEAMPFDLLVKQLNPDKDMSRTALFDVLFQYEEAPVPSLEMPHVEARLIDTNMGYGKYDLHVALRETGDGLEGALVYNSDIFDHFLVTQIMRHFEAVLRTITTDRSRRVGEVLLLDEDDLRLQGGWNATEAGYPRDETVHGLFERQVGRTPDRTAVCFGEVRLTYRELDRRSNRLARHLRQLGVRRDELVGLLFERSPEMIVAILAVLKAGAAYLPLDPASPDERLRFIIEDARIGRIVATADVAARVADHGATLTLVDEDAGAIAEHSAHGLEAEVGPQNVAYCIYTSGSTGKPKGALIQHRNVVRLMRNDRFQFDVSEEDAWTMFHSYCFDFSVWEMYGALLNGGKLVVVPEQVTKDPPAFLELLRSEGVTVLNQTPGYFSRVMQAGFDAGGGDLPLRYVIFGGEALDPARLTEWQRAHPAVKLVNMYGITETTVHNTFKELTREALAEGISNVGRPIPTTTVHVVDADLHRLPVGVPGELHVGGDGLVRGYLHRPGLTAERFLPDDLTGESGARLYKTGDVGRYWPTGDIEFLGRADDQIKIRGYRVELGEVESVLAQHPDVEDAVVILREDTPGDARLVAYSVSSGDAQPSTTDLRRFVSRELPDYMVPGSFVTMKSFPLTPNGKIDKRALPAPDQARPELGDEYVAPRGPLEESLAGIWSDVLGVERVGVNDNFFHLGGHSLLATQVVSRVRAQFDVDLPLRELFERPTVVAYAEAVAEATGDVGTSIEPAARDGALPLSFAQGRLWFLDRLEQVRETYNVGAAVRLTGPLQVGVLEQVVREVVQRHEALRTTFAAERGRPQQVVHTRLDFDLRLTDLRHLGAEERGDAVEGLARHEGRRPFDLSAGPLLRVTVLDLGVEEHVALFTMHHIVSDGWSMGVLVREVAELYESYRTGAPSPLADLPIQYADYAVWQRGLFEGGGLEEQLEYWRERLAGAPPTLDLPTDRARPAVQTFAGTKAPLRLGAGLSSSLRALGEAEGVTPFMTLLAGFCCLLSRYSTQTDIVLGSPIAGRNRREMEGLIGFFVNTLALRIDLSDDPTVRELLGRVRETALGAYGHQDVPLEKLLDDLDIERDLSRSPLFQVVFALQNAPLERLSLTDLSMDPIDLSHETAKFDLLLNLGEDDDGFRGVIEYNTDLFDAATIARMSVHYERLLGAMVHDPDRPISELEMLDDEERRDQIAVWNERDRVEPDAPAPHERFEEQVARAPDAVALVTEAGTLTYRELDRRANRLAHRLRGLGVGPEVLVGLCMDRSAEMIVGVLGILKAGGAYVPLDPAYPPERLAFMMEDAGLAVVVSQDSQLGTVPDGDVRVVSMDGAVATMAEEPATSPGLEVSVDNVAYVIYTSGSTGKPKGTPVTHRNVARLFSATDDWFGFGASDVWTLFHSYAFDFSVWEMWGALCHGGRLVVVSHETSRAPDAFLDLLDRERVTVLNQTPSAFRQLVSAEGRRSGEPRNPGKPGSAGISEGSGISETPRIPGTTGASSLRYVVFGGEALEVQQLASWFERHGSERPLLVNMYGITETTVHVTYHPVTEADLDEAGADSPIGRPIPDLQIYVREPSGALSPVGVPGEVHVGGGGVARGYLGRPDLTAERFVPDPWGDGTRLYRTGDAARYLKDGRLGFRGRLDQQVKVRGFRIELGEIEAVLAGHPELQDAVVLAREDTPGQQRLVAYVVPAAGASPGAGDLRGHLLDSLPDYMVPGAFVTLEALPLTANGKLDRKALPAPDQTRPELDTTFVAPTGAAEEAISDIWSTVLGIDHVGRDDNFFELGGTSLLLIEVHARIVEWRGRDVPVVELFQFPTVNALARHLGDGGGDVGASAVTVGYRANEAVDHEPIAVIGMAGRFPGARDIEAFWSNLRDGVESIRFFTDEELTEAGVPPEVLADPSYVKAKGWLDDAGMFDAALFGYSPREAELTDPQHRLFLQCAVEALEHAGYDPRRYRGAIGVFGGTRMNSYAAGLQHLTDLWATGGGIQAALSSDKDHLTTRVSYKLNLRGPSVNVQTACSTSLVAVHQACRSILDGECDMALAGGVSVSVPLATGYRYREDGIVSPDGHCRPFDADAKGTVSGNGVGLVVLKRLSRAVADGDLIHGVVLGTAINNDGALKVGYTAPSLEGQAEVIEAAVNAAGVDPETIGYVEAHGTGTALGDPIEVAALTRALGKTGSGSPKRYLGAVKSNFGHLDAAAGVAGFIKTVLCLEHGELVPTVSFQRPNPRIDLDGGSFAVSDALQKWETESGTPRRAGVSSFGIGGTNAHVVLEEPPVRDPSDPSREWQLLLLSAKTRTGLGQATERLAAHLRSAGDDVLADSAYTLKVGRQQHEQRRAVVCRGVDDAVDALEKLDTARVWSGTNPKGQPSVVFMFTGQGAQYPRMGRELYASEPVFREVVDDCSERLIEHLGFDLRDVLYPDPSGGISDDEAAERLKQTSLTQPALFVVELATARLLMSWGIVPSAMIGHSIGEYVAACLSGVLTEDDALRVVCERGRLMHSAPTGSMLAVALDEEETRALLGADLSLAALNAPGSCVVSGAHEHVDALEQRLTDQGVDCHRLRTSHAFHSALMEGTVEPFVQMMEKVHIGAPKIPYLSNVTGTWVDPAEISKPEYWARQMRATVRFADGVAELLRDESHVLLEVGPGDTLRNLARRQVDEQADTAVVSTLPHPRETVPADFAMERALGQLWVAGVEVDWQRYYAEERRVRVALPSYPFQQQRYWVDPPSRTDAPSRPTGKNPDIGDWFYVPTWRRTAPGIVTPGVTVAAGNGTASGTPGTSRAPVTAVPRTASNASTRETNGAWLVFADDMGLGSGVAELLDRAGEQVFVARPGAGFERTGDRSFTLDPTDGEQYERLLSAAEGAGSPVTDVVHLWTVTGTPDVRTADFVAACEAQGFHSLLNLARALGKRGGDHAASITIVSDHVHDVTGHDVVLPEKATVLGPARVIPREYPELPCRHVDIELRDGAAGRVLAEHRRGGPEGIVAYRGVHRLVETHEPIRVEALQDAPSRLRDSGVYLVTGGLGGMGLALAEHLATSAGAKLALIGRTPLPDREEWSQWLSDHDEDDPTAEKIRHVRQIEERGGEVLPLAADVSDVGAMRQAVERAERHFGAIQGVIHTAGVADGALIPLRTPEMSDGVFAPKVAGALVLDEVLAGRPLDFFVLCSSLASIQAPAGQVAYCAANAFLDAFAHYRTARDGSSTVAINWDTWQDVGMAVDAIRERAAGVSPDVLSRVMAAAFPDAGGVPTGPEVDFVAEFLRNGITPSEGSDVFDRVLACGLPQVVVSTQDLSARIEATGTWEEGLAGGSGESEQRFDAHPRPELDTEFVAPSTGVEQTIAALWRETLGVEPIGSNDNFFDLGGDSLSATQLLARVRTQFAATLPMASFFNGPTVAEMARQVDGGSRAERVVELSERVKNLSPEEKAALLERARRAREG